MPPSRAHLTNDLMVGNAVLPNENQIAAGILKTMWLPWTFFCLRRFTSQERSRTVSLSNAKSLVTGLAIVFSYKKLPSLQGSACETVKEKGTTTVQLLALSSPFSCLIIGEGEKKSENLCDF